MKGSDVVAWFGGLVVYQICPIIWARIYKTHWRSQIGRGYLMSRTGSMGDDGTGS